MKKIFLLCFFLFACTMEVTECMDCEEQDANVVSQPEQISNAPTNSTELSPCGYKNTPVCFYTKPSKKDLVRPEKEETRQVKISNESIVNSKTIQH